MTCADETLLCEKKININSNNSTFFEVKRNDLDDELIRKSDDKIYPLAEITNPCTRQLEIYLESRGIRTWDEHEYTCIGEAASSSSLESTSHELISEGNSSGYNSSGIDDKSKRDSDSISTSSRSDSGEMNCVSSQSIKLPVGAFESTLINNNNTVNDIENSIKQMKLNDVELKRTKRKIAASKKFVRKEIDYEEISMFHEAVRSGDAKKVEELAAYGSINDLDEPDWNVSGDPPLLVAATNHYLPVLR